ncbi:hypothetical protein [Candidatus Foliamicus sp.]
MDSPLAGGGERAQLATALADIAVRAESQPELWRGYFERLLSGRTIGPLPFDAAHTAEPRHAIAGQCALALKAPDDEQPGRNNAALQELRVGVAGLKGQDVALGVDLSGFPAHRFGAWLTEVTSELKAMRDAGDAPAYIALSLRAEHAGSAALMKAAAGDNLAGFGVVLRVGPQSFGAQAQWPELVDASHRGAVELVLCRERAPLTDLVGKETPDAVMPLSLFEAPAGTAWLGMQFDLSTIPVEQIERGVGHLKKLVRVGVRLADNLIDCVSWPSGRLRADARANRRLAAHVTGIGDLALRHGMNPEQPSTVAIIQRWLRLFKRQLLRESLRLAGERGPYPALDAGQLVQALTPRYGADRADRIIAQRSPRHRQLLALSPYCVLPRKPTTIPASAWLNLLPVVRVADNLTMHGSEARALLDRADYERLLRRTWALSGVGPLD